MTNAQPDRAAAFFLEEVEPTAAEFLADWRSIRRGRLAAIVLAHMADHYFHARTTERQGCTSEDAFRCLLADADRDFALICDVANASKHAELRIAKPPKPPRMVTSASQVASGGLGWGEGRWNEMRWNAEDQVIVTLSDGSRRALEGPVRIVLEGWRGRLGLSARGETAT